ncbi:LuxR C-terminal-related transcriptional regulator [Litchfieldella xinjiangensis]|uniref:LuxR C-terminal-related transcriptional regulator n=1 Tax=Litchfieldella xinjiangensis TaxID=1166948 RepID=UPI0009DE9936|nr:LuxR C-terminal-related transcriptional regulator [Halomonas xinjiangensis]
MNSDNVVLLVTANNPQTQLFIEYLKEKLAIEIEVLSPEQKDYPLADKTGVLLIDTDHIHEESLQAWHEAARSHAALRIALLNVKGEAQALASLGKLPLHGVFYRNDSLPLICKGIRSLFEGDLWMSRSLMTRMIDVYRQQQLNAYRPACGLTQREVELIGLLGMGESNTQIASRLFVSEHTVKSHLYNIFKKINVRNRIQAMNWAQENLSGLPPMVRHRHASRS